MSDGLKKRRQCAKCPWRVDVDPRDIPGGYCEKKHAALKKTIAEAGSLRFGASMHVMACHEFPPSKEQMCIGWLANQLGPGNNIGLRMQAIAGKLPPFDLVGPQHARFEDTLPDDGFEDCEDDAEGWE